MQGQPWSLIQTIEFIVIGGIGFEVVIALFDDHVTGGAGTASSTGVFDVDAEIDRNV